MSAAGAPHPGPVPVKRKREGPADPESGPGRRVRGRESVRSPQRTPPSFGEELGNRQIGYFALDAVSSWQEVAPVRAAGIAY